jgi:hypothetical protein
MLAVIATASLVVAGMASLAASVAQATANGKITFRSVETLKEPHVTDGGVAGTGSFTISGVITDAGKVTDYRRQNGTTAWVRRVAAGKKGTITFLITINLNTGSEPWRVVSGTKAYKGLHGKGVQVVDRWMVSPSMFVMKGTLTQ